MMADNSIDIKELFFKLNQILNNHAKLENETESLKSKAYKRESSMHKSNPLSLEHEIENQEEEKSKQSKVEQKVEHKMK